MLFLGHGTVHHQGHRAIHILPIFLLRAVNFNFSAFFWFGKCKSSKGNSSLCWKRGHENPSPNSQQPDRQNAHAQYRFALQAVRAVGPLGIRFVL